MLRRNRTLCARVALAIICLLIGAGFPDHFLATEARAEAVVSAQKRRMSDSRRARDRRAQRGRFRSSRGQTVRRRRAAAARRRGGRATAYGRRERMRRARGRNYRGRSYRSRRGYAVRGSRARGYRMRGRRGRHMRRNIPAAYASRAPQSAPYRPPRSLVIPEARTREIQEKLKEAGFYDGEITGQYDERTREAMRNFQRANGMKETGTPTAPALLRLGLTKHTSEAGDTSAPPVQLPPSSPTTDMPPPLW